MRVKLFTGPDCSLCDQAKELVYPFISNGFELEEIDVTKSIKTKKDYGLRIPVLVKPDGKELGWPFNSDELKGFLSADY